MQFLKEAVMHVDAGVEVRLGFVVAHRAREELAPTRFHPPPGAQGEPLPLRAAAGTILRCAMGIDLHGDGADREGLLSPESIDLPA